MRIAKTFVAALALLASTSLLSGQTAVGPASAARAGSATPAFSAERLARIDRVLQQYVDENRLAGVVALVQGLAGGT